MDYNNEPPTIADYYEDLGVSQTTSIKQIRKAYLNLARATHPDKRVDKSTDAAGFRKVSGYNMSSLQWKDVNKKQRQTQ